MWLLIHQSGLSQYYSLPRDGGQAADLPGDYSYFDDPLFLERFTTCEKGSLHRQVTFFVPGIHCAACIWLLEQLPGVANGIKDSRVDFSKNAVTINYDPTVMPLSEVGALLASLGYAPLPSRQTDIGRQRQGLFRRDLIRLGVAGVCLMNIMMLAVSLYEGARSGIPARYEALFSWVSFLLCLPPILYCAQPFYRSAIGGIRSGILHIDLPISIALILGFCASVVNLLLNNNGVYFDSIASVIFLLLAGRMLQQRTVARVLDSVGLLAAFTPQSALRVRGGQRESVYVESLVPGDVICVEPASTVPADGMLLSSDASIDTSVLTGESEPEQLKTGARIFAGSRNVGASAEITVTAVALESRLGKILSQVQLGVRARAPIEKFLDRVGRHFTLVVLVASLVTFVVLFPQGAGVALNRVLALLIVSCPCAIALATPLAFAVSMGRAARTGFLLKSAEALEQLSQVEQLCFDKTGTLTQGRVSVQKAIFFPGFGVTEEAARLVVAALEEGSEHPVAKALLRWADCDCVEQFTRTTIPGRGVRGTDLHGREWKLGSIGWLSEDGVAPQVPTEASAKGCVALSRDGVLIAMFVLADTLRPDSQSVVHALARRGVEVWILSGDRTEVVSQVAQSVGIPAIRALANLAPEEKAKVVKTFPSGRVVAMVGDGVNDVAAFNAANVGIGVSGGAEACLQSADVYLTSSGLEPILKLLDGAQCAMRVVRRNLYLSLTYNCLAGVLAIAGYIGPLEAAVLMPLSSLVVVLHSIYGKSFEVSR